MLGRSFVGLVVPRYTQEKASDLSVLILRSSFFQTQNARGTFHNRLKPSKLTWTAMYRKQHKKDIAQEAVKKRRRATKKPYSRSIVGATLEVIKFYSKSRNKDKVDMKKILICFKPYMK
ncbi:hypothetical protein E1A91_D11G390100v1 [Gossypium mustelinum]|uniref:60S ribosomal protein L24-like n=4 Tax=Gossypium TaxID=3633 RepID=A0ABM3B2E9_GOSHI|nr:60S ribosomal protein L24-like [Gossypium hirsutum]XP_040961215.1 60S ribosomal protein L24-like [Gossypium hirsutum]XP_040961216.1 60S ribosomal protein L24-like [Gossypium hirsutum]TYI58838.1 hypothetical protein E1A91_D11G390100v1 [Gossypium mustelinum]